VLLQVLDSQRRPEEAQIQRPEGHESDGLGRLTGSKHEQIITESPGGKSRELHVCSYAISSDDERDWRRRFSGLLFWGDLDTYVGGRQFEEVRRCQGQHVVGHEAIAIGRSAGLDNDMEVAALHSTGLAVSTARRSQDRRHRWAVEPRVRGAECGAIGTEVRGSPGTSSHVCVD